MTSSPRGSPDVLVIGAGPAGLFAAWRMLQEGLSVTVLEARPRSSFGQRWCVDVEERYFIDGIVPAPAPGVALEEGHASGLLARPPEGGVRRWSSHRFPIRTLRLWRLQEDLLERVECLGGRVRFGQRVVSLGRDGRGGGTVDTSRRDSVSAKALVIAAGTRPVDDRTLSRVFGLVGDLVAQECIHAHHDVREIDEQAFITAPGEFAKVGTVLRFGLGGMQGFSLEKLACHPGEGRLLCLGATFPQDGHAGPREVLASTPSRVAFAGPVLVSGGQPIPLRRALPALTGRGVALVGDAGSQVMPLTGSGTGLSALAALLLAPAMRRYVRTGSAAELWEYSRGYHAEAGAEQLRQDLVTRLSRRLPAARIQQLADLGVLQIEDFRRVQAEGRMIPRRFLTQAQLSRLPGLLKILDLAPRAAPTVAAVLAVEALYRTYPKDPAGIGRWGSRVKRLLF
ncbi:MAG: FAD-dependent oxidoreductase [Pseudomonadota bacterium]